MMKDTKILEQNVKNSFHFVKDDIFMLEQEHKRVLEMIAHLEQEQRKILRLLAQQQKRQERFLGNMLTGDLHKEDCLLAQGSSPEHITVFASQVAGQRQGFRDCVCLS